MKLFCILGLCLQTPLTHVIEVTCLPFNQQTNCTFNQRDKGKHFAILPGTKNPITFSGGGRWSFSTIGVVTQVNIDGKMRKVRNLK